MIENSPIALSRRDNGSFLAATPGFNSNPLGILLSPSILFLAFLICLSTASAQKLSDEALSQIRFDQKLNAQVALDLHFTDENGRLVSLAGYFSRKPVVLMLGYYQCPMLCTLVLNGLVESAEDMKWTMGRDFDLIFVSIDSHETPALASDKKQAYLRRYGRSGAAAGWHFLTGTDSAIRQLAQQVGFHYAWDTASKQFAHPSGLIVLTPQGKVAHYLFGVTYPPGDLYAALSDASAGHIASPIRQLVLLCFHYNPLTGKYSAAIMLVLRLLAVGSVLGFGWMVFALSRARRLAVAPKGLSRQFIADGGHPSPPKVPVA